MWRYVAIPVILAISSAAFAQLTGSIGSNFGPAFNRKDFGMGNGGFITGNAPPPPVCSNSLDFSAACNSQYLPLLPGSGV